MDITTVQNRIIEEMTRRGDWMDRYAYLTEQAPKLPEEYQQVRKDENAVSGCQSQVWVDADYRDGRLYFRADSDTVLTKGIIALILQVVDGRTPEEIVGTDLYVFRETGMESNLSPARSDGLNAIIRHIRMMARQYVTG